MTRHMRSFMPAWLAYAFLAIFWWGAWGALAKVGSATMTPGQMQALFAAGMLPLAGLAVWKLRGALETDARGAAYGIANGVFSGLGLLAYNAALAHGQASVVGPTTTLFPVVTVGLAVLILHERVNRVQCGGIVLAMVAIYLLAE